MIDLNADVGEGFPYDALLMQWVTSCNIACGAHAGDPELMATTVQLAHQAGLTIGAHPGYPDRLTFGREVMPLSMDELYATLVEQLAALAAVTHKLGVRLFHVKPHGALYNLAAHDCKVATTLIKAVQAVDPALVLIALANSPLIELAQAQQLRVAAEGFLDRAYAADGTLVPRSHPHAVHADQQTVLKQAFALARSRSFPAVDTTPLTLRVHTLCVHGDTPAAVELARAVRQGFAQAQLAVGALPQVLDDAD